MSDSKQPQPQPKPTPQIGTRRPHPTNPYLTQKVTGFNGDGTPVWRKNPAQGERR